MKKPSGLGKKWKMNLWTGEEWNALVVEEGVWSNSRSGCHGQVQDAEDLNVDVDDDGVDGVDDDDDYLI